MDIAYYISDLLGQQGELTVPNLGYFVQIRMPAYYDSVDRKFFPPHYSVQFDPQVIDEDDALANHITAIKKISASSAKYFIEKYITNLKSQAFTEDVPFANLGSFTFDGLKLTFNTSTKTDDPSFFAYTAVDAAKIGETPVEKTAVINEPSTAVEPVNDTVKEVVIAPLLAPDPAFIAPEPAYIAPAQVTELREDGPANPPFFGGELVSNRVEPGEFTEEPKRLGIWIIVLITFTLLVIALGALYKFKPELFRKNYVVPTPAKPIVEKDSPIVVPAVQSPAKQDSTLKNDSLPKAATSTVSQPITTPANNDIKKQAVTLTEEKKPAASAKQVTAKPAVNNAQPAATAPSDGIMPQIIPKGAFIITSYVFPTLKDARARVAELKGKGFQQARLLTEKVSRGGNYKVILGVYNSREEGNIAKKEFMATGKLKESELSVEQNKRSLE